MYTYTVQMDAVFYILKSVILFIIANTAKGPESRPQICGIHLTPPLTI